MRFLTFIVLAVFLAGPASALGSELRVLVSDNSGIPLYGIPYGEVQRGEIRLFPLEPGSHVSATSDLGGENGAVFDVPPGAYGIRVFALGWFEFEGVIRVTREPRVVRVALNLAPFAHYWPAPPPDPSLEGQVLGLRGRRAWVQLSYLYGPNRVWRRKLQNVGVGAQGEFAFSRLQAGRYVLFVYGQAEPDSSEPVVLASQIVDVGIGATVQVRANDERD